MTKKWHGGKGSTARDGSYSKQFKDNWDKIFGKKKERAGLNWELEDERTHTEKAREDFLATREIMKDYPTHRELMAKQGKPQTE
ncbi:hypothetical protein N9992_00430 [bacterium]|jgi:hypothetical protein|nr:hypothetical protein [bacterium]|tara:strand:+ start:84 stop:335 length:252 start_codon:yes stop_codon:yes gene_type:complete